MVQAGRQQVVHQEAFASEPVELLGSNGLAAAGTPNRIQDEPPRVTLLQRAGEVARLRHLILSTEESYLLTIRRFLRFHASHIPRRWARRRSGPTCGTSPSTGTSRPRPRTRLSPDCCFSTATSSVSTCPNWVTSSGPAVPRASPPSSRAPRCGPCWGAARGNTGSWLPCYAGPGLRLMEGLRLRVKDIDFERLQPDPLPHQG